MIFNWINEKEISINSYLLMDPWMLKFILTNRDTKYLTSMGIVFNNYPTIHWYMKEKCPGCLDQIQYILSLAPQNVSKEDIQKAAEEIIKCDETFIVYLYPEMMNRVCEYITEWDEERLLELVDFKDKVVLDIGSGTGRLAFAASKHAKMVYALEPGERMREFMRTKIKAEKIPNVKVLDGFIEDLPYEDNTFDIVMSAHVIGDDIDREMKEMTRVTKNGGYIIECMGEDNRKRKGPDPDMLRHGFTYFYYSSKTGGDVYRYLKQVEK